MTHASGVMPVSRSSLGHTVLIISVSPMVTHGANATTAPGATLPGVARLSRGGASHLSMSV